MFGVSFTEVFLVGVVALFVVGPQKLPTMLATLGKWVGKLRRLSTEVRYQIGIDEILRQEGLSGGLNELRGLMRGNLAGAMTGAATASRPMISEPQVVSDDRSREYPVEGPDAYGAVADDLLDDEAEPPKASSEDMAPSAQSGGDETPSNVPHSVSPPAGDLDLSAPASSAGENEPLPKHQV